MTPCQQEAIEGPSALVKPKGYWGRILQNIIITYQIHRLNWKRKKPLVICRLWRKSEVEFMADKALELAFKLRPLLCIRMKCMYIRMFYCTFKHSCMYAWMRTYTHVINSAVWICVISITQYSCCLVTDSSSICGFVVTSDLTQKQQQQIQLKRQSYSISRHIDVIFTTFFAVAQ